MKDHYIRNVARCLAVPKARKQEITRDLQEIFADALENGESERQVIDRLGSPAEFAAGIHEELGIIASDHRKKRFRTALIFFIALSAFSLTLYFYLGSQAMPRDVIGSGKSMTNIHLPAFFPEFHLLLLGMEIASLFGTVLLAVFYRRGRRDPYHPHWKRPLLMLLLSALFLTACSSSAQPQWTLDGIQPEFISAWPENEFTSAIVCPAAGTPDYILDASAQGHYCIFLRNISKAESAAYIQTLKAQGYIEASCNRNTVSIGTLLRRENVSLSISSADGTMGIVIAID